ncbi:MAG: hypothetical protein IH623_00290 [Verrucomicrobia bacterium]|nr:hypothetical protein [Verrucomicrobiota bacterium]
MKTNPKSETGGARTVSSANPRRWPHVLLLTLAATLATHAATLVWTNSSGGNWNLAANWEPNQVPGASDTAIITNDGTYIVTLNVDPTVAVLLLGGSSGTQTLTLAGRTLTLNGSMTVATNGLINFNGGSLAGSGHYHVEGTLNWVAGTVNSNATMSVAGGGLVTIASGPQYTKYLYGSLTNAGTIVWQPSGSLYLGGTLHNTANGLFDAQMDGTIGQLNSEAVILNEGVFRKSAGPGNINCYVRLINLGTVDVQTGRLTLATPAEFQSGCAFTGAGQTWMNSGTNVMAGDLYSENLVLLYGATLVGTGVVDGTLSWEGGTLGAEAAITLATNSHLRIGSAAQHIKVLNGSLTNAGTITWTPLGTLQLAGTIHNLPGARFDIQTANTLQTAGASPRFINDGVIRRTVDAGSTSIQVPLINRGTVDVQTGRIDLSDGSVLSDGSAFTGAGVTRLPGGTITLDGTVISENLQLNGATMTGSGLIIGSFNWSSGVIDAALSFSVTSNSTLTIGNGVNFTKFLNGNLTNAGTVTWLPAGSLMLGGLLHNQPGGLFEVQTDSTLASNSPAAAVLNEGVFRKSAGSGTATCGPLFANHGVVEISSGRLSFVGGFTNPVGTVALAGGTFQKSDPLHLAGGLLTGWGNVWTDVTNSGTVRPSSSNGVLTVSGRYEQTLGGVTEFELAGNLPGTNQSRLNITGAATLRGIVDVRWSDGFAPEPGANFPVMTFASRRGEFSCYDNCLLLGQGRRLVPVYSATSFNLNTVAAPEPEGVPLHVVVDGGALVAWPVEFTGYQLYWSTNLAQTNWTLLPGATNRWLEFPPLPPAKFYRLHKP